LRVNVSEPKTRLFIGNIPKSHGRDEIEAEFRKLSGTVKRRKSRQTKRSEKSSSVLPGHSYLEGGTKLCGRWVEEWVHWIVGLFQRPGLRSYL
jgi:hypothetical protein